MSESFVLDTPDARDRLSSLVGNLPVDASHQWEVTITRKRDLRTNGQLRAYWKWLRKIADHTGMGPSEIDLALRLKFTPQHLNLDGQDVVIPGDVSGYDVDQFGRYLDWVCEFAWREFAIDLLWPPKAAAKLVRVA